MHIWAYACVHTHIHLTSHCGPPVRSGAPVPLWFSALWYHAGQIFLSAWMTPWHGVYLDWQLVFIWIDMQRREKRRGWLRRGAIRSAHQSALTWRTWANNGRLEEVEGGQCVTSHYRRLHWRCEILKKTLLQKIRFYQCSIYDLGLFFSWSQQHMWQKIQMNQSWHQDKEIFVLFICFCIFLCSDGMNSTKTLFSVDRLPSSTAKGGLIKCHQSEMRVKWRGKSWIFTLIWLTPGGLQSLMAALICIVLCAPHPSPLTINSFNTFALI